MVDNNKKTPMISDHAVSYILLPTQIELLKLKAGKNGLK